MMLNPTLMLSPPLELASPECCSQDGKTSRVQFNTFTMT